MQAFPVLTQGGAGPSVPSGGPHWLGAWSAEPLPLCGVLLAGGLYLLGVRRLRAVGNPWAAHRTVMFLGPGLGSIAVATMSPLATYDTTLLSVHMVQHMLLAMVAPIFLALGAPLTLALRTLPPPGRRRLLAVMRSGAARVLSFPVVAGAIFVANPFVLYFTGYYELTLRNPVLHDLNHAHFVLVGALWYWPLIGVDPTPRRLAYPIRLIATFLTLPFHAFLGLAIMSGSELIAGEWYEALDRQWGPTPLRDQQIAGGILWLSGDLIALLVVAALFLQWARASEREARREDRRLDRLDLAAARGGTNRADPPAATHPPTRVVLDKPPAAGVHPPPL